MSTFNRTIPFLALCLCGLLGARVADAEVKMGVVNFQKLLEEAPQTKTAMAALERLAADRKLELAQAVAELLEILAENGARAARRHFHMPAQS